MEDALAGVSAAGSAVMIGITFYAFLKRLEWEESRPFYIGAVLVFVVLFIVQSVGKYWVGSTIFVGTREEPEKVRLPAYPAYSGTAPHSVYVAAAAYQVGPAGCGGAPYNVPTQVHAPGGVRPPRCHVQGRLIYQTRQGRAGPPRYVSLLTQANGSPKRASSSRRRLPSGSLRVCSASNRRSCSFSTSSATFLVGGTDRGSMGPAHPNDLSNDRNWHLGTDQVGLRHVCKCTCFTTNTTLVPLYVGGKTGNLCSMCTKQFCLEQAAGCKGAQIAEGNDDTGTGYEGQVWAKCFGRWLHLCSA